MIANDLRREAESENVNLPTETKADWGLKYEWIEFIIWNIHKLFQYRMHVCSSVGLDKLQWDFGGIAGSWLEVLNKCAGKLRLEGNLWAIKIGLNEYWLGRALQTFE